MPGCVVLSHDGDPLGGAYYGWAAAPEEPGPAPESPLEAILVRTTRVGLSPEEAATPRLLSESATS